MDTKEQKLIKARKGAYSKWVKACREWDEADSKWAEARCQPYCDWDEARCKWVEACREWDEADNKWVVAFLKLRKYRESNAQQGEKAGV